MPIDDLRARRVELDDIYSFDLILAMDRSNYSDLASFDVPEPYRERIQLFRSFDPEPTSLDVPDPYYGGANGFEDVFQIVSRTCDALIPKVIESLNGND
jgi:protein-tyrosine phosphatase